MHVLTLMRPYLALFRPMSRRGKRQGTIEQEFRIHALLQQELVVWLSSPPPLISLARQDLVRMLLGAFEQQWCCFGRLPTPPASACAPGYHHRHNVSRHADSCCSWSWFSVASGRTCPWGISGLHLEADRDPWLGQCFACIRIFLSQQVPSTHIFRAQ